MRPVFYETPEVTEKKELVRVRLHVKTPNKFKYFAYKVHLIHQMRSRFWGNYGLLKDLKNVNVKTGM